MKNNPLIKLTACCIMILGMGKAQAALTLTWGAQNTDTLVLAASTVPSRLDVPLNSIALYGVFNTAVTQSTFSAYTTASQFLTGFTQLASSTIGSGTGQAGTFGGGGTITTGTDTYLGKQLYYIIGNASTIAASTQLGVFTKSTWLVPTNPTGPTPTGYTTDINQVGNTTSSILFGSYIAGGGFGGANGYKLAAMNLAAVPEPSVASLLALGTVGLVALRARRKS